MDPLAAPDRQAFVPVFLDQVGNEIRDDLLRLGTRLHIPSGGTLINQGDLGGKVYLLLSGWAKLTVFAGGFPRMVDICAPGELVGESSVLTGRPYRESAVALGAVTAVVFPDSRFLAALTRWPAAFKAVAATAESRLARARRRQVDFVLPLHHRLAAVLLEIGQVAGDRIGDGIVIMIPLSQTDLAALCGAGEDSIQKALRALRSRGAIRTGYRRITLIDLELLTALALDGNPP